ncbi:uncharacterized protein LOC17874821 isoform X2 [Capsella rubella]|uniref:uncharacterized protein LOC17874821 isoform X2 n=1 Tax=Capsella rubella TaxID=81985 RepID=UPI000CD4A02A|nr:uncharacterized protein LOC17874821 isoform X2 [Capsella rubella]
MGIVAFNWAKEGNNRLTLVMNRDNWANRVINGASWEGQNLSGRSVDNNGTWFAISRQRGRVAFLMSSQLLGDAVDLNYSGGELYPILFLESDLSPLEFARNLAEREAAEHKERTYCLVVADMALNSMVCIRKRALNETDVNIRTVPFGVHTLSPYYGLDSHSTKDSLLENHFTQMIGALGNDQLPLLQEFAWNFMGSPGAEGRRTVFVEFSAFHHNKQFEDRIRFGTTSTTALAVERTGGVTFFERYRDTNGEWKEHDFRFNIQ